MAARIRSIGRQDRPEIRISLNGQGDAFVPTYSTLDRIEGTVSITCPIATLAKNLEINFLGTSKTFVERMSTSTAISGRTEAFHQFLKLSQPISDSAWPQDKLLEARKTYTFNFVFVIPQQLLPRVCRHSVSSDLVHQAHLTLPPSFGDKSISGRGNVLLDDHAPEMARIKYTISATLTEESSDEPVVKSKKVRVLPVAEEQPPLTVEGPDSEYSLRAEKDVKKGVFKGKLGRLVVETVQPKAMRIPSYKAEEGAPETTIATVNLRFDPVDGKSQPPKLNNLNVKFKVATFYSSSARSKIPTKSDMAWDLSQGVHTDTIALASRNVSAVEWVHHEAPLNRRRESSASSDSDMSFSSDYSNSSHPEPSTKYNGSHFYTARILVPISLPQNRAWVPTFHTCLISRSYSLHMNLSVQGSAMGPSFDLKVPVQLSSEGNPEALAARRVSLTAEELAVEAMDADDFFAPRTITPMDAELVGGSNINAPQLLMGQELDSPPEYDAFPRGGNRVPIRA